jgi:cell division protease FtsH
MSDENRNNDDQKKNGDFKMPSRNWVVWIVIVLCVILVVLFHNQLEPQGEVLSQHQFQELVDKDLVESATIKFNAQSPYSKDIIGKYYKLGADGKTKEAVTHPFRARVYYTETEISKLLSLKNYDASEPNTMVMSVLISVLPLVVIAALIWFFFIRQIKMAGKGALSFGKSKARMLAKEKN